MSNANIASGNDHDEDKDKGTGASVPAGRARRRSMVISMQATESIKEKQVRGF